MGLCGAAIYYTDVVVGLLCTVQRHIFALLGAVPQRIGEQDLSESARTVPHRTAADVDGPQSFVIVCIYGD